MIADLRGREKKKKEKKLLLLSAIIERPLLPQFKEKSSVDERNALPFSFI